MKRTLLCLLILTTGLAASACDSPTQPRQLYFEGSTWIGALPANLPQGDWSKTTMRLSHANNNIVDGSITSRDGVTFEVVGQINGDVLEMFVWALPFSGGQCPGINFRMDRFWYASTGVPSRMHGMMTGRCFGTINGEFTFQRIE